MLTLVTGPVRSGKSRFAERLARESGAAVTYAATARVDPQDGEWRARIAQHVARRPASWRVVETATRDGGALDALVRGAARDGVVLVDSLGTWLDAQIVRQLATHGEDDLEASDVPLDVAALDAAAVAFADACATCSGHAIVVGEEVGWGIVPAHASARAFRDVLGRLQQRLAVVADAAYLVVAGYAIDLHAAGRPVDGELPA